jgi:hypothetical protein
MRPNLDIPRWLFMLGYVAIRAYRGGEDMGIHSFCTRIAKLGLIVVGIKELVLFLSTDDTEAT